MAIELATDTADFSGIRKLWEERFTTCQSYLDTLFREVFPLCKSYVHKIDGETVSVASFMPMKFISPNSEHILKGFYMFGVATTQAHEGKGLAVQLIKYAIENFSTEAYDFVFERPANQSLNNYYFKLGFSYSLPKQPHLFNLQETGGSTKNIPNKTTALPSPEAVLNEIKDKFPKRFEWENTKILEGLINLGEVEYNNEIYQKEWNPEETYIAINTLSKTDPQLFKDSFFCLSME